MTLSIFFGGDHLSRRRSVGLLPSVRLSQSLQRQCWHLTHFRLEDSRIFGNTSASKERGLL